MYRIIFLFVALAAFAPAQINLVPLGSFTHSVFGGNGTIGVCSDSYSGEIWVVDFSNGNNLHRFDLAGLLLSSHATTGCTPPMSSPNGLTQDRSTGTLWMVDNTGNGIILGVDLQGNCLSGFTFSQPFTNPVSIAHNPVTGDLQVGSSGQITAWSLAGAFLGTVSLNPVGLISGLAYVPSSGSWLVAFSTEGILREFDAAGNQISTTDLTSMGITNIQGLDYDPFTGRVLVVDNSTVTVHIFADAAFQTGYQTNQIGASLDIDGINGMSSTFAAVNLAVGQTGFVNASSINTGQPWDLGVGAAPLVSLASGAITSSDGQILNLNVSDPTLTLLWNNFTGPGFLNFASPISFAAPTALSAQMIVFDPSQSSGISISQPLRLQVQ